MKRVFTILTVSLLASGLATAGAYQKCAGCHGANGEKKAMGKSKIIKDMSKDQIVAALKGYKAGTYGGAMKGMMTGQVTSLTDANIKEILTQLKK